MSHDSHDMDMPDTVTSTEASHTGSLDGDYDDAAGYYTPGDPISDKKAPGGPLEEQWNTRQFEARIANPFGTLEGRFGWKWEDCG